MISCYNEVTVSRNEDENGIEVRRGLHFLQSKNLKPIRIKVRFHHAIR